MGRSGPDTLVHGTMQYGTLLETAVRALLANKMRSILTVLGITIDASSATIGNGEQGGTLTLAQFFTQAVGHGVKVEGTLSGSVVTASQIRIDDENGDED